MKHKKLTPALLFFERQACHSVDGIHDHDKFMCQFCERVRSIDGLDYYCIHPEVKPVIISESFEDPKDWKSVPDWCPLRITIEDITMLKKLKASLAQASVTPEV